MNFLKKEIYQITENIWGSILNLRIFPCEKAVDLHSGEPFLTSCIHISGQWEGAVTLDAPGDFARQAARIMFGRESSELTTPDIQDVLGELTNMISGNIKSILPGSDHLSLPTIVEGVDFELRIPGSQIVSQVGFECQGHSLVVSLYQKN